MRRSNLTRADNRSDRPSRANHSSGSMRSVLVVSGQGKPTRYLGITGWRVGILVFFLLNGLVLGFLLGLFLHDVTAPHQNLWMLHHRRLSSGPFKLNPAFMSKFTATAKTMSKSDTERMIKASKLAKRLGLGTRAVAGKLLAGQVEPEWLEAAQKGRHIPKKLMWPVPEGWYVRGYGSGEAGYHLAVDIMGERGTAVRAAAPGIVAYSNNDVRGYGNMVILIHPGGWITVYAHNSSNLVHVGERIGTGRTMALLGSTGISRGPHVHFEFIFKGNMCNPTPLFRPGVRHRYGNNFPIKQVLWNPLEKRPKEIMCQHRRRHPRSYYYDLHPEKSPYRNDEALDSEETTLEEIGQVEAESAAQIPVDEESMDDLGNEIPNDEKTPVKETQKEQGVAERSPSENKKAVKKTSIEQTPKDRAAESSQVKAKPIEKTSVKKRTENNSSEETTTKETGSSQEKTVEKVPSEEAPKIRPLEKKAPKEELPEEAKSAE